jgi:dUTP pyrophosphatase
MGAKKCLIVGAHIIDSGYSGEVFIDLHNVGLDTQIIKSGTKIAQLILIPVIHFIPTEVETDVELYTPSMTISNRGDGALGSTGQ